MVFDGSVLYFTLSFTFAVVSPVRIHTSELHVNMGSGRHAVVIQIQLKFVVKLYFHLTH